MSAGYEPSGGEILLYQTPAGDVRVECLFQDETIWLTQKAIAALFGVGVPAISKHLKNIFESGELLEEVVVSILEITTQHGAISDNKPITTAFTSQSTVFTSQLLK
jgi:hypothetical protein